MTYFLSCYTSFVNLPRMATAYPQATEHGDDNFVLELNREKDKVRTRFIELREILTETENKLMKALNDILSSYNSYRTEVKRMNEEKEIENILNANMIVVPTLPDVRTLHEKILQELNEQPKQLQTPIKPKLVSFVCDKNKLLTEVNKLCKLVETVNEIDYKCKTQSIISVYDKGTGNEQLNRPLGVTVDHDTGNVYVVDHSKNCVKVFDNNAKYVFKFGDSRGEGKMDHPKGLVICFDKVLISQHSHHILVFQLDGKFVSRIGNRGSGDLQFGYPFGLTTDESNNDIYICDFSNNRIQIISQNFQYKSQFGLDILHYPLDIKLYKDNIFVIDKSNPCLHIFNKDLELQKSVIARGEGQQVIYPRFFFIDKFGDVLISDCDSNSILILNSEFEFIHKISTSNHPMGITMDKQDRVIVVCQSDNNCLQIF